MCHVCRCKSTSTDRVKRWDVYDIADELADVPMMIDNAFAYRDYDLAEAMDKINGLVDRLWAAADRGGRVGPSPDYLDT